jgi:hypothetical protein
MTTSSDSTVSPAGGRWLYPLLLALQTIGAILFYWKMVPLYQQLVADPTAYATREETRVWSLAAIALIQVGYWVRYRVRPALPGHVNPVLGHFVLFVSRLSFILATAVFSFVFISQRLASQMPAARYVLTLAGLFSLFCYMQELNRLGNVMMGQQKNSDASAR